MSRRHLLVMIAGLTFGFLSMWQPSLSSAAHGETFPEIYNSERDTEAQPMTAEAAAESFLVPSGFQVNVFASEPEVQNPIAMTWDSRGRLWVAENFTYAERKQRFDLSLHDRVLIFEDTDSDGVADKRTVFTDDVQMLTSVEVGHGGVWLMCPSRLLFFPDKDRDDKPDGPAVTVLDGFDVAKANYHNFANGLKWGPDGWLYGRCGGSCPGRIGTPNTPEEQRIVLEGGIWRFHPRTKQFEVLSHGTTNPWGHDWNRFGDGFFINTVNGHLWQLIPGAHYDRPFTLDPNPHVYELIQMHADHWHFDTTGKWNESRDGAANDFGGGHAHCGMSIYLGGHWPAEYRGRLFTLNFHGRRANQEVLKRQGSGYVGKHGPDTLIAKDPFFRGMEIGYGPDGNMFVLDWSDTGECHESTGVHRTSGRVYRLACETNDEKEPKSIAGSDLRSMNSLELVDLIKHPNQWFVRQARLILSERATDSGMQSKDDIQAAVAALKEFTHDNDPEIAYRALTTLSAMDSIDDDLLRSNLSHKNEHLRAWAIRLISDHWPIDNIFGPTFASQQNQSRVAAEYQRWEKTLCQMARTDSSGLVRLALASMIQRLPTGHRRQLASALMSRAEDAEDHNLPLLVWYGLIPVADTDPLGLATLATESKWPKTQRLITRRLVQDIESSPQSIDLIVSFIATAEPDVQENLLLGLSDGLKGWSNAPQPADWPKMVDSIRAESKSETKDLVRELSILFGDGRALDEVRRIVLDGKADISIRRTALEALVASKSKGVAEICLPLLGDPRINAVALKGVAPKNDVGIAKALVKNYRRFRSPQRPLVIEVLASRPQFAAELLSAAEAGKFPLDDLTAYDVRQIRSLGDPKLQQQVSNLWGEIRETSEEKTNQIAELKKRLTPDRLAKASPGTGRVLFNDNCAKCHRLFGYGQDIGPELTGANRSNIDYLLENIVDPSSVVSKNFGMTIIQTVDGQTLNGLVAAKNDKTLSLQTQNELKTILLDDIEGIKQSTMSPMPDGMLDKLSEDQIADLFNYLMQPAQVDLPGKE
ncbi:c-type cytochrome [bacterium]|nr:c-type cytochrome [bacterium]